MTCSAEDCTKRPVAKGLCRSHYDATRWALTGRHRVELRRKAAGIEIVRGRTWVDDSGFTQIVVCEECGRTFGPWVQDRPGADLFARRHRDEHRDRTQDEAA